MRLVARTVSHGEVVMSGPGPAHFALDVRITCVYIESKSRSLLAFEKEPTGEFVRTDIANYAISPYGEFVKQTAKLWITKALIRPIIS